jgi:hypothetical protein
MVFQMNNHKTLLADFYLRLLSIPVNDIFRITNQSLYAHVLSALAIELESDAETVQNIFERMASEDSK